MEANIGHRRRNYSFGRHLPGGNDTENYFFLAEKVINRLCIPAGMPEFDDITEASFKLAEKVFKQRQIKPERRRQLKEEATKLFAERLSQDIHIT